MILIFHQELWFREHFESACTKGSFAITLRSEVYSHFLFMHKLWFGLHLSSLFDACKVCFLSADSWISCMLKVILYCFCLLFLSFVLLCVFLFTAVPRWKLYSRTSDEEILDSFHRVNSLRTCERTYGSPGHASDPMDVVKTAGVLWLPPWPPSIVYECVHVSLCPISIIHFVWKPKKESGYFRLLNLLFREKVCFGGALIGRCVKSISNEKKE